MQFEWDRVILSYNTLEQTPPKRVKMEQTHTNLQNEYAEKMRL